ncbi:TrkA family potassium uptake protein [Shewanella sp. AS16]|uniref:potassium channel family protein n=1 Tax=Shewanella sp. AS16 TaxID=2907625 RepID=UPI001F1A6864|nr:TrkA family potassium uptake protein [Shewanella sp. AS16]MCE9684805.1 TrkA family potassium uptake protein [Shewanella sp. AS16]
MRIVFIGASRLTMHTARQLLSLEHDVVIIERDKDMVENVLESLGCGVIHGDGSKPQILQEAGPDVADYLFCVTNNDQTNIIASLVGRSIGFRQVVTRIDDPEFEHICIELGLENTIIPSRTISRYLAAIVQGQKPISMSALLKNDAALFSFVVSAQDAVPVKGLKLPDGCRLMFLYRRDKFILVDEETQLKEDDEAVIVCHSNRLGQLRSRWLHTDLGKDALRLNGVEPGD